MFGWRQWEHWQQYYILVACGRVSLAIVSTGHSVWLVTVSAGDSVWLVTVSAGDSV